MSRAALVVAVGLAGVLLAMAGRYGYHRDELYFLAASRHLAWGYPDQGPLVPALARLADSVASGSLVALRLPSALLAAGTVLVSALVAREVGGGRRAQAIAAACTAVSALVLAAGHLLSTTTPDLFAWSLVTWLALRASRSYGSRLWLVVGAASGLALLVKPLVLFLLAALVAGVAISGPRRLLRDPWVWGGAVVAAAIATPYVLWQAAHGWPQLDMAQAISSGSSGSSQPRWLLLPMQLVMVSPFLAPVWIAGLVGLFRDPALRRVRFLGWAYVVLAALFLVTGGKPYYLAQLTPALLGVGAVPVARWARTTTRIAALGAGLALSGAVNAVIALPLLPAEDIGPVLAVNYDAGETVGWQTLTNDVSRAVDGLAPSERASAVILAANYGEAGALDRFGRGLPPVFSGHNGYGDWGPPAERSVPVIVVGYRDTARLDHLFAECQRVGTVDNRLGVDNDEQGAPITRCDGPRSSWARIWPDVRHLG